MAVSSWNDNGQKQFVHDPCKFASDIIGPDMEFLTAIYSSRDQEQLEFNYGIICFPF